MAVNSIPPMMRSGTATAQGTKSHLLHVQISFFPPKGFSDSPKMLTQTETCLKLCVVPAHR